ncbi:hypothetical protein SOVF_139980 [Spinacia oleracea]|nr:hypothetical protein SOVF_139980 [Spinacia oleracea]
MKSHQPYPPLPLPSQVQSLLPPESSIGHNNGKDLIGTDGFITGRKICR